MLPKLRDKMHALSPDAAYQGELGWIRSAVGILSAADACPIVAIKSNDDEVSPIFDENPQIFFNFSVICNSFLSVFRAYLHSVINYYNVVKCRLAIDVGFFDLYISG